MNRGNRFEKSGCFLYRHVQHIRDGFALVVNLQSLSVIARPVAHFAIDIDIGKKVHFDGDGPIAGAVLASAAFDVETEPAGLVAPHFCFGSFSEKGPDFVKHSGVGGGITSGRASNGGLVDVNNLVQLLHAFDSRVEAWDVPGTIEGVRKRAVQNIVHQRGLARSANPGDCHNYPQRDVDRNVLKVVGFGAFDTNDAVMVHRPAGTHINHGRRFCQVPGGDGPLFLQ